MHYLIPLPMSFMAFVLMAGAYANRPPALPPGRAAAAQEIRHVPAPAPKRQTARPTDTVTE